MRVVRRWGVAGIGAVVLVLLAAATGWACIAGPTLRVNPGQVKPGEQVAISGISWKSDLPIVVRFNALDGPILGTFTPSGGRFGDDEFLNAMVTIPTGTKAGDYLLIATQSSSDGSLAQVPVRALVTVTGSGGAPAVGGPVVQTEAGRPVGPVTNESSTSTMGLILVGVGAAGVAILFAGIGAVLLGRRRGETPALARTTR